MTVTQATIKRIRQLHDKKGREKYRECIVEGKRALKTVLAAGTWHLKQLYITHEEAELNPSEFKDYLIISASTMRKISTMVTPPGYLGIFALPNYSPEIQPGIVLADIQDPGNMGTIIRTAVALHVPSIVIVQGADVFSPKVIQATAGTIASASLVVCSWKELVAQRNTIPLCALVIDNAEPFNPSHASRSLLVVGNEGSGIPKEWLSDCQRYETLSMPANAESLNAAIAASIALYLGYNPTMY